MPEMGDRSQDHSCKALNFLPLYAIVWCLGSLINYINVVYILYKCALYHEYVYISGGDRMCPDGGGHLFNVGQQPYPHHVLIPKHWDETAIKDR